MESNKNSYLDRLKPATVERKQAPGMDLVRQKLGTPIDLSAPSAPRPMSSPRPDSVPSVKEEMTVSPEPTPTPGPTPFPAPETTAESQPETMEEVTPPEVREDPLTQDEKEIASTVKSRFKARGPTSAGVGTKERYIRMANKISYAPNTKEREALLARAQEASRGLTPVQKEWYEAQLSKVRTQSDQLLEEIRVARDTATSEKEKQEKFLILGQAMESIGHNLTRIFAANYGLKKGVDMSGLRFDKFDWESTQKRYDANFNRIMEQLESRTEAVGKYRAAGEKEILGQRSEEEKALQKQATDLFKESSDLAQADQSRQLQAEIANQRMEQAVNTENVRLEQQRDLEAQRIQLARDRMAADKAARLVKNKEKQDEVATKVDLQRQQAVAVFGNKLASVAPNKEEYSAEEVGKAAKEAAKDLAKAGIDINSVIPDIKQPDRFFGIKSGKIKKEDLYNKLNSMNAAPGSQTTRQEPTSSGIIGPSGYFDTDTIPPPGSIDY